MVLSKSAANTVVAAVCLVFIALRLFRLTDSCLWFDEIFSIHAAEHPWNSILQFVALDLIHPPLFYILLKIWIAVGGESLVWLRLFPVVFSVFAIFPLLALCRELKLAFWTRILALFFFAINGSLIKYAQEVRMYSPLLCLSLFSMWLFARYFVKGKSFIPLLTVNILLVYTHYFGWFVVSVEVVAILIFQRIKRRRILMMFAITIASFTPWIFAVWRAARAGSDLGQNIGWMTRPGPKSVGQFVVNLIEPFYYAASSVDPISIYSVSLPILLITILAIVLYLPRWKRQSDDERQMVKVLLLFAALPLLGALTASWLLPYSIWGTRHLIIVFFPVSILLALALTKIWIPAVRTAALTLILLFTGYAFVLQSLRETQRYSWCAWEPLAYRASQEDAPKIFVFEDLVAYHFWFASRDVPGQKREVVKIQNLPGIAEDTAYFLPRGFHTVKMVNLAEVNDQRFWIAFRAERIDLSTAPLKTFIDRGYRIADREVYAAGREQAILILFEK